MTYRGTVTLFWIGFGLSFLSWMCVFIAFASPYWFQSWPRMYSPFRRIGLWDLCSNGMVAFSDKDQRSYFGCWWIFAPYYHDIRGWIMPWWFILTQIIFSFAFLFECLKMIFEIVICVIIGIGGRHNDGEIKNIITKSTADRVMCLTTFDLVIDIVFGILKSADIILFGIAAYYDRNWMPEPDLNYLSWSYGFALISCFMSLFSIIPHIQFRRLLQIHVKYETGLSGTNMEKAGGEKRGYPNY